MDSVQSDLRAVFGTENAFTMPISGTGSAGMESVMVNLIEPGDRVVIGVCGVFGMRMVDFATRLGANVVEVKAEFGTPLDPEEMGRAIAGGPTALVALVHAETSTGVLQPLSDIVRLARDAGALVMTDCVTSLGGAPVGLDALGVDAAFSGTQKCLSVPPGLAPVTLNQRALDKVAKRQTPSWYFDFSMLSSYWGGERAYHHTAPVSMIYGLGAGLRESLGEGLDTRFARHRDAAAALYRGLEGLGLNCFVDASVRAAMLTTVSVPDGIDEAQVRRCLRGEHAIEIGGGLGPMKGRVWRVGLMGHGARRTSVLRVIAALGNALAAQGQAADVGAALVAVNTD